MEIETFANRLQKALDMNNMKQVDLCAKTNITSSLMNKYIKGKAFARQTNIYILAKALNVSEAWLMGFNVPSYRIPNDIREHENIFQYSITDTSMLPLLDIGDVAFIEKTTEFQSGQTILFKLDNKEYIRKVLKDNDSFEFHAMNPYFPILKLTRKELKIKNFTVIGRVIKIENKSAFK